MKRFDPEDIKRIKSGDNRPLKLLFNSCFENCVNQLTRDVSCSRPDAEDIVMDSMLVVRDKIMDGEFSNDSVQAYLATIAKNRWRNKIKRDNRLVEYDPVAIESYLNKPSESGENEYHTKRVRLILNSINELTGACKDLLSKNLVEGIPLKNLVEELEYSTYDVIKTSKSRCMKKLRVLINNSTSTNSNI